MKDDHSFNLKKENKTWNLLKKESFLDKNIRPLSPSFSHLPSSFNILLTGATGFLGAFLIKELLKQTTGKIYCLVRASDLKIGKQRVYNNLRKYGLWQDAYKRHIAVVLGNLSRPQLGLSNNEFEQLSQKIDIIYHNGAHLNYIYPYKGLKAINVESTRDILKFAVLNKLKPVHYVSSIVSVASSLYAQKKIDERQIIKNPEGIYMAYGQSKWVAEQLVLEAGKRGVPVSIYRPTYIAGHSKTGAWNTNDFICRLIKGAIQTGALYDLDTVFDIVPVNYVSEAIVYLSTQTPSEGKSFHLINPKPWSWKELIQWLQETGYDVKGVSYQDWLAKIKQTQKETDAPLHYLLPFFSARYGKEQLTIPELYTKEWLPSLESKLTQEALSKGNIICPPVDRPLMEMYLSVLIKQRFLNKPDALASKLSRYAKITDQAGLHAVQTTLI